MNTAVVHKSLAVTASFPSSKDDPTRFRHAMRRAHAAGFDTVEFCYRGPELDRARDVLQEYRMRAIFLGPLQTKPEGLVLCAPAESERVKAVEAMKARIEDAHRLGCRRVQSAASLRISR